MDTNTWAITPPATDDDYYFAAGSVGGAGAITLLKTKVGVHGAGYKVTFHSVGDSSARTWTIVGHAVGTAPGVVTTEVVAAGNNATTTSTNYFDTLTSVTASGAMTGNQKVGFVSTTVALPATYIRTVYWVAESSAGSIVINRNSATGTELLKIDTPAAAGSDSLDCGQIRVMGSAATDFALITPTTVTKYTLICG